MQVTMMTLKRAVDHVNQQHSGGIELRSRQDDEIDGYCVVDVHGEQLSPRYRRKGEVMGWIHGFATGLRRGITV